MMRFDWKDGLLIAVGFAVFAALLSVLRHFGVELGKGTLQWIGAAAVLGPSSLRRYLFGQPVLGRMRQGLLPSLASIVGLLGIFFGVGVMALTVHRVTLPQNPTPDFEAEVKAWGDGIPELDFGVPGETREEAEARRVRERADRAAEMEQAVAERAREWSTHQEEQRTLDWTLTAVALGLLGFGSLALWARYEPVPKG